MKQYVLKRPTGRRLLINYGAELNQEQHAAVTAGDGPLLVIAGAGSGKTRVITYRVAWLVEHGVDQSRILLVTFTNKAAREMLRRVEGLLQTDCRRIWGGTFHHIGNRILREHAESLGYQPNYSILDSEDSKDLLEACVREAGIDTKSRRFPRGEVLRDMISYTVNTGTPLVETVLTHYAYFEALVPEIELIMQLYQKRKLRDSLMDYDDLLINWKRLLEENPAIRERYADQFKYILVDEYQDTNKLQADIVDLLATKHRNVIVVGDDAQCLLPETEILTGTGPQKIPHLKVGSRIVAASGFGSVGTFTVTEKLTRHHRGPIVTITTKAGRTVRLTPEHICYARLQPKEGQWYVYLMYRADKGYRLGLTRGIRHGKNVVNGLMVRANQERADKMWIILITDSLAEARYYEELLSVQYGIPKVLFYALNREPMAMRQEHIDKLYTAIDTRAHAEKLMEDFLLFEEYPHFRPQAVTAELSEYYPGRCQAYLIQFGDRRENKIFPWHAHRIRITTANKSIQGKFNETGIAMRADKKSRRIETSRKHFTQAHDFAQRLSQVGEIDLCKLARLTKEGGTFSWQPASHLRVGMLVPVFEEGEIKTDEIVSTTIEPYEGEVYDLNIEHVNNFVANGVIMHNSIFGWRGANFANIFRFKDRYPDAHVVRLEANYRSTPQILGVANDSIAHNQKQFPKELRARRKDGPKPALVAARDVYEQAEFVASRVLELYEEGVKLSDIAVLYRSHYHSMELQVELMRRGLPYVVRSGLRFFEQAHTKDVIAYLRAVANPHDELAWMRILRMIPGIGQRTAEQVWQAVSARAWEQGGRGAEAQGIIPRRAQSGWQEFVSLMDALTAEATVNRPAAQIELVLASDYMNYLRATYANAEMRAEDLRQLATFAARYQSAEGFLSEVALIGQERFSMRDGVYGETQAAPASEDEYLVLSSIHQAKGLEWRIVFIIWAADGRFPSARSMSNEEAFEEERRVFYVATTRAKDELYVCYPLTARESRRTVLLHPSRFVAEVADGLFEKWIIEAAG